VIKKIGILAALMGALFILPNAASACQATSQGAPVYVDGSQRMISGITCDNVSGDRYEVRTYLQGSSGGYHSVHVPTPFQVTVTPNTTGYTRYWTYYENCTYLTGADDYVRIKTVIENLTTHKTDTAYSGPNTNPQICQ